MKTLYLSDLDGTLLNHAQKLSEKTIAMLNPLLENGLSFTLSTARTPASSFLWSNLRLTLPISTMNGVMMVNPQNEFLSYQTISPADSNLLMDVFKAHRQPLLFYTVQGQSLVCYTMGTLSPKLQQFVAERSVLPYARYKRFEVLENSRLLQEVPVVFVTTLGSLPTLQNIQTDLQGAEGLAFHCYQNVYAPPDYFLEFSSKTASKAVSAQVLKRQAGADKLVVFGDNNNDLPMFLVADECYATANATPALKQAATAVIESCDNDGVARWLVRNFKS